MAATLDIGAYFERVAATATVELNDTVRAELARRGDPGLHVREVEHCFVPLAGGGLPVAALADALRGAGYEFRILWNVNAHDEEDESLGCSGVLAIEHREVASTAFDAATEALAEFAADAGWEYDGWNCVVVRPAAD